MGGQKGVPDGVRLVWIEIWVDPARNSNSVFHSPFPLFLEDKCSPPTTPWPAPGQFWAGRPAPCRRPPGRSRPGPRYVRKAKTTCRASSGGLSLKERALHTVAQGGRSFHPILVKEKQGACGRALAKGARVKAKGAPHTGSAHAVCSLPVRALARPFFSTFSHHPFHPPFVLSPHP